MSDVDGRRLKIIEFSVQAIKLSFTTGHLRRCIDGVPSNADVVDAGYDHEQRIYYMTLEHYSFDRVMEGERIPRQEIQIKSFEDDDL